MVFIEQREKQKKDTKQLEKQVNKASYEQRQYNNLSFLYANPNIQQSVIAPYISLPRYSNTNIVSFGWFLIFTAQKIISAA